MNSEPRRKFDQDFKRNAVLLCTEPGRSVVDEAENLGTIRISYIGGAGNITGQMGNMCFQTMELRH